MRTDFSLKIQLKHFSLLIGLVITSLSLAQKSHKVLLKWQDPTLIKTSESQFYVPTISDQELNGAVPNFSWINDLPEGTAIKEVNLLRTELAPTEEVDYLEARVLTIDNSLNANIRTTYARYERKGVVEFVPFIKKKNGIHRVVEVEIVLGKASPVAFGQQKDFVSNSVLRNGSGEWYKISVNEDGIYRLDYDFLVSCFGGSGLDLSNISSNAINLFGNGEGKLPELNSTPRTDDLAKNAIQMVDGGDGVFGPGDYFLFHGWGPDRWYLNSANEFDQDKHIYTDVACYFININPADTPLRVGSISDATAAVTNTVVSYDFRDVHERDLQNLVGGGQRWYGELFDGGSLTQNFVFRVPDVDVSTPARFRVALAANAKTVAGNTQNYLINGTTLASWPLPIASSDFSRTINEVVEPNPQEIMPFMMNIQRNSPDVLTYLDRIVLNARANLVFDQGQLSFRDIGSVGVGNVSEFQLTGLPSSTGYVWDVTDKHQPKLINGQFIGGQFRFVQESDSLREYIACDGFTYLEPNQVGSVQHQDLHALTQADYLIVSHPSFMQQAERLANLHRDNGLVVHVVTTEQIYNEFSSGVQDATAIKFFAKMFYDRGQIIPTNQLKHLLLFGDGTYDPKNRVSNNNNYVVAYQVINSESHISSTVADDYYGMLDDTDGNQSGDLLDIGVGRLLISNTQMGDEQVNKIEHYMRNGSNYYAGGGAACSVDGGEGTFGDWRARYVQIADDEEGSYFIRIDSEPHYEYVKDSFPDMNSSKIYLDAFQQTVTAGGQRYPDAVERINEEINRGSLVFCYVGHGGEVGVAEERVITVPQIQGWSNIDRLPLMVSATCEFTKFDDPSRVSAGEWASINPTGGAIALMTTTRSIYFGTNSQVTSNFYKNVFRRDSEYKPRTFGEIISATKNAVGGTNKRSFTLIGDPALRIALPYYKVVTDSINGYDPALVVDTMKALSFVTVKGHVEDFYGNTMNTYNGVVFPSVFDKPKMQETLVNDPTSSLEEFELQNSRIYRGKASVNNGYFEFDFIVPKDINYSVDTAKISYYAEDGLIDGIGSERRFLVGSVDPNGINDDQGPDIELYMNDEQFVNGGTTNESPMLVAKLYDESGINSSGAGIGHDLVAILDEESSSPIVLNEYYQSDLDSYQSGEIRYEFSDLEPGQHTLSVKVWDVNNNSSTGSIDFVVRESEEVQLDHVLNYPNPFTTHTEFFFEHNQVCSELDAQVQVLTISGRLVKTINTTVNTEGFRSEGIAWDGRDDFGDQLAKGVYVYRLRVRTPEGAIAEETEKLVILK